MNELELEKFLKENAVVSIRKERPIRSRHYNLRVHKDGETVVTEEYLTIGRARELKAEYNKDGYQCDIIEDVTVLPSGEELVFKPHNPVPFIKGVGGFGTPSLSPAKNAQLMSRIASRKKRSNKQNGETIRYSEGWRDRKSPNYRLFLVALKRQGYTVKDRYTGQTLIIDFQKEVAEFLFQAFKDGWTKEDFIIRYNGVAN